jgi:hypothetical protein
MIFLFHVYRDPAQLCIDGKTFIIPPNELFEVTEIRGMDCNNNGHQEYITPPSKVAELIIARGKHFGIIEVPLTRRGTDVQVDIEDARRRAKDLLRSTEDQMLMAYVREQQERAQANAPVQAPGGRVLEIIQERGLDIKKEFNINPVGWVLGEQAAKDNRMEELERQNAQLQSQMKELLDTVRGSKGKGKPDTVNA